jgi:TRAP-type mannitol/chloroaromatic compound transport system permease small subunit
VLLIAVEIVMRRTVGTSPGLSFEYSGYVLGISASWSFAYALFHKAHIRIDAAYVRFAPKGRI